MTRRSQRITSAELREIFNGERLWERTEAGEFFERVLRSSHPAPRASGEPNCTKSQIVGYFDQADRKVATVHQYVRPNGTLGASGRPDPKAMVKGGVLYFA